MPQAALKTAPRADPTSSLERTGPAGAVRAVGAGDRFERLAAADAKQGNAAATAKNAKTDFRGNRSNPRSDRVDGKIGCGLRGGLANVLPPLVIYHQGGEVRLQGPALRAGPLPTPRGSNGRTRARRPRAAAVAKRLAPRPGGSWGCDQNGRGLRPQWSWGCDRTGRGRQNSAKKSVPREFRGPTSRPGPPP